MKFLIRKWKPIVLAIESLKISQMETSKNSGKKIQQDKTRQEQTI